MNVFFCHSHRTCLFIVLSNIVVMTTSLDHPPSGNESGVNYFSGEFENFLQGLGSMVYKYKKPARQNPDTHNVAHEYSETTTADPTRHNRRNENLLQTQKEVLKDVLMMKLVSYYEDKYKVTHTENQDIATTTISTSTVPILNNGVKSMATYAYKKRPRNENSYNVKTTPIPKIQRMRNAALAAPHRSLNDLEEVEVL